MQGQKPVKLYFFVTFLLILGILFIGLKIKDFLANKIPEKAIEHETKPKEKSDEITQTFAIVDLAVSISLVLVLLFVFVKVIMQKLKSD